MTDPSAWSEFSPQSAFLRVFCTCVLQQDGGRRGTGSNSSNSSCSSSERAGGVERAAVERWTRVLAPAPLGRSLREEQARCRARGRSAAEVQEQLCRTVPEFARLLCAAPDGHRRPLADGTISLDGSSLQEPYANVNRAGGTTQLQVTQRGAHCAEPEQVDDSFLAEGELRIPANLSASMRGTSARQTQTKIPASVPQEQALTLSSGSGTPVPPTIHGEDVIDLDGPLSDEAAPAASPAPPAVFGAAAAAAAAPNPTPKPRGMQTFTPDQFKSMLQQAQQPASFPEPSELDDFPDIT